MWVDCVNISIAKYAKIINRNSMTCLFNMIPNGRQARCSKLKTTFINTQVLIANQKVPGSSTNSGITITTQKHTKNIS